MQTLDLPQPGHFPRLPLPGSGPGLEPCSTARLQPRYWSERFFIPVTVKTDQETPLGETPVEPLCHRCRATGLPLLSVRVLPRSCRKPFLCLFTFC